jgi:hypothetical protein
MAIRILNAHLKAFRIIQSLFYLAKHIYYSKSSKALESLE